MIAALTVPRIMDKLNEETVSEELQVITVGGQAALKGDITTYYELIGNTYSNKTVPVLPAMPGKVASIEVSVGDFVNEGDVLFVIDGESLEAQVTQAELGKEQADAALAQAGVGVKNANAGIASAQLAYEMAKSSYEMNLSSYNFSAANLAKYEELYAEGIVSEMEIEQMRLQANPETLAIYEKQLQQAEQGLAQAKLGAEQASAAYTQAGVGVKQADEGIKSASDAMEDLRVTAPVSGYITQQNLTEDTMAANTSVAMMIDELQVIKVSANVTANQVGSLEAGDQVEVYVSATEKFYQGTIETISLTADARTMLYPITILVENDDLEIKPGMFATVHMVEDAISGGIIVPTEAVVVRDGKTVVFVYDGSDMALMKEVLVGLEDGYNTQILEGISEGDVVITDGVGLIDVETPISVVRGDM